MSEILEISDKEFVLVEKQAVTTLDIENEGTLVVAEEVLTLVSEAAQGPQGIPGPRGEKGEPGGTIIQRPAAIALSGHRMVMLDGQGSAIYASNADQTHANRIVGMTTHAADAGAPVAIAIYGELTEPTWNWETDKPVYLGADGFLTQVPPEAPAAKFSVVVGFPISATTLFINIGIPITLIA